MNKKKALFKLFNSFVFNNFLVQLLLTENIVPFFFILLYQIIYINISGIPTLNLPSVDPFEIKECRTQGTGNYNFQTVYTNIQLYGYTKVAVSNAQ